jgi:hypothetical protein
MKQKRVHRPWRSIIHGGALMSAGWVWLVGSRHGCYPFFFSSVPRTLVALVSVGSGHGYQFRFRLRCWVGFPDKLDISWGSGLCTRLPVGYLLHKLELKKYWPLPVLTGSGLCTPVTSWSRSVFCSQAIRQCAQEPPHETRQDWTGQDPQPTSALIRS